MLILLISLISISAVSAADDYNNIHSINANEKLILEESINEDVSNATSEEINLEESINEDVSNAASEELILEETDEHFSTDETKATDLDSSNEAITDHIDEKLNSEINDNEISSNDMENILKNDSQSNLSNENIHINITQENNFLYLTAIDSEGNIITEGDFTLTSEDGYSVKGSLYGMPGIMFNLFALPYDEYPQALKIDFIDDEGQTGNASYFASLENTLIAHDVVDEFTFEVSFLAEKTIFPLLEDICVSRFFMKMGTLLLK